MYLLRFRVSAEDGVIAEKTVVCTEDQECRVTICMPRIEHIAAAHVNPEAKG
jgi:hypothetical protein